MNLPTRKVIDFELPNLRNKTLTEFLNPTRELRERRLYINYVVTAEAHKRRGVATRLVEAAEDWARRQRVTLSLCDTYIGSPESVPFWEKRMGYEQRSIRLRKRL
jgi:GNAT superfamily N-acetyltransferase